uniref:Uncharacterized protein n=1 Tax=Rheinheimera sp. BAL341 TaxID=1708203 RepID=A0A486XKT3_9GAMM
MQTNDMLLTQMARRLLLLAEFVVITTRVTTKVVWLLFSV